MLAIGMDVHSSMSTAHAAPMDLSDDEEGEFCEEFNRTFTKFPSTRTGMSKVADFIGDRDHCILIENSTKTHELFWIMDDVGLTVIVAHSTDLYRITKSVKKTDAHDSQELAHYMRRYLMGEREFAQCYIVDGKWMKRRQLCRLYAQESEFLSNTRRQIRSYLLLRGMKPDKAASDIAGKKSLRLLEKDADDALMILITRARESQERMKMCRTAISKEFRKELDYELLMSIPGFGEVISGYLASMVVDIGRFDRPEQFSAYLGIVPKQRESADSAPRCGITRHGDEVARTMLLQATYVHIINDRERDSPVSRQYDRLKSRGLPHKKALTAAGNKMSRIVYGILKSKKAYRV